MTQVCLGLHGRWWQGGNPYAQTVARLWLAKQRALLIEQQLVTVCMHWHQRAQFVFGATSPLAQEQAHQFCQ